MPKKGTPQPIIDKINKVVSDFIKRPDVQDKVYGIGIQPKTDTPEEFAAFIPAEQKKWSKVIADAEYSKDELDALRPRQPRTQTNRIISGPVNYFGRAVDFRRRSFDWI